MHACYYVSLITSPVVIFIYFRITLNCVADRRELILAGTVSSAIVIAILSMPDVMEPIAESVISRLGYLLPLAVFVIGIIHGLKPDEHTWSITISYAMMQRTAVDAVKSTVVFGMALTTVWTALSALVGQVIGLGSSRRVFDPQVGIVADVDDWGETGGLEEAPPPGECDDQGAQALQQTK